MKPLIYSILLTLSIPLITRAENGGYQPLVDLPQSLGGGKVEGLGGYLNQIFFFGLAIAVVLAVLMIIWGGVLYMGGDSVFNKDEGRKKITAAIGGLILALAAWLILNTINSNIIKSSATFEQNLKNSAAEVEVKSGDTLDENGDPYDPQKPSETDPPDLVSEYDGGYLSKNGVDVKSGADIIWVKRDTINGAINLAKASNQRIIITSGTEGDHKSGTYSHANGYKLDIGGRGGDSTNPQFDSWMTTEIKKQTGLSSIKNDTNYTIMVNGQRMTIRPESNHWDVLVR